MKGGQSMENKCPNCGCEKVINGDLVSTGGLVFVPENQNWLIKKSSYITAIACKKCGTIFGLKLSDKPSKLTE